MISDIDTLPISDSELIEARFFRRRKMIFIYGFFLLLWSSSINAGDEFEDYRCKCVCPSLTVINNSSFSDNNRRIYVNVVQANNCSCKNVVFLSINASDAFKDQFCLRCACNYEVRNTTTMKVVVIIIMVSISLLFIYMSFLLCLDPIMNQSGKQTTTTPSLGRSTRNYQRQINDDVQIDNPNQGCVFSEPEPNDSSLNRNRATSVLDMVTQGQSKWRKQVNQQRQSVYARHDLLN